MNSIFGKNKKKKNNDSAKVMIGSGDNAIFVTKRKDDKYMLSDGTIVRAGDTLDESSKRLDDRIDDIVYSKPVAFVKKLTRRNKKR